MAVQRILRIDNDADYRRLSTPALPVRPAQTRLRQLVTDLFDTLMLAEGVGLAAPQIGVPLQVAVIDLVPPELYSHSQGQAGPGCQSRYVLINPKVEAVDTARVTVIEGCLSLPGWYGEVVRAAKVSVSYQDLQGQRRRIRDASGLLASALQHEIDHLQGVLFTKRLRAGATLFNPTTSGR